MRLTDRPWAGGAAALAAGALPALTLPAPGLWWLGYVALVPWLLLLRSAADGRSAARCGWLGGTGLMLATHHWLLPNLHLFLLLLAALIGALWAPWGWLAHRLLTARPTPAAVVRAVVLLPAGWLAAELVRSWEYLGGPWGLLGAGQWQVQPALRLMSVGGVWLVSLLLVLVNTALVLLLVLLHRTRTPPATDRPAGRSAAHGRAVATAGGALALAGAVFAAGAWWVPGPVVTGAVRVLVVQPGVVDGAQARFDRSAELTRASAGSRPDLVVWGESSVGFDPTARPDLARELAELSALLEAPLLVNVDARRPGGAGIHKSSVLVDGAGPTGERYDKMRLVPFGEYVPARSVLGWVTSVGRAADEDRRRGTEQRLLSADGLRLGPLICFETAFPDMSRQLTREGAGLLVAQSATSTFQESWAPWQHASLAALRAAETGRPVVHATLTGVSAVFGPDGRRSGPVLDTDTAAARTYTVPLAEGTTGFVRHGEWVVPPALAALLLYGLRLAVLRRAPAGQTPEGHADGRRAPVRRRPAPPR